ncbi:MAG: hypothetical protein ACI865_003115 [Flavobacteriaceae bacterium]|jgi:hypothetical protein
MKFIITSLIFTLFIACISFAQPISGTYILGGSGSVSFNKSPSETYNLNSIRFGISPSIGKFISEKYVMEGGLGYSGYTQNQINLADPSDFSRFSSHSFSLRFGITRFFPITDKLYFTLGTAIVPAYVFERLESESIGGPTSTDSKKYTGRFVISPGLTYFINDNWMLYSYMGVLNYEIGYDSEKELFGHSFYARLSANSFGIGARYILMGKTKSN